MTSGAGGTRGGHKGEEGLALIHDSQPTSA